MSEQSRNVNIRKIAADLLDLAAAEFSNHGCNDYELPITLENIKIVKAMMKDSGDDGDINDHGDVMIVTDWLLMQYCAKLLREGS